MSEPVAAGVPELVPGDGVHRRVAVERDGPAVTRGLGAALPVQPGVVRVADPGPVVPGPPVGHQERHLLKGRGISQVLLDALLVERALGQAPRHEELPGLGRQDPAGQADRHRLRHHPPPLLPGAGQQCGQGVQVSRGRRPLAPDLDVGRRAPAVADIAVEDPPVTGQGELPPVEQYVLVGPGRAVVVPHGVREVVLHHQDLAVASGDGAPDDATAVLDGYLHAHRAGRGEPRLDVVQGHGAGAVQLAGDSPVGVRVHERVTAEVGRLGIPAAGPDQLQALALRYPAHAGLAYLLIRIHVLSVPEGHLEDKL